MRLRGECLLGGLVELLDLVFRDGDLALHLDLLDAADEHLPLELLAKIFERHAFLLECRLKRLFGLELVLFLDVLDDVAELLGAERVSELAAALNEEQLVNGIDDDFRRDFGQRLSELGIAAGRNFGSRCRSAAICRCSRSVLVMMSPFTLTRICSRMSVAAPRRLSDGDEDERESQRIAFHMANT